MKRIAQQKKLTKVKRNDDVGVADCVVRVLCVGFLVAFSWVISFGVLQAQNQGDQDHLSLSHKLENILETNPRIVSVRAQVEGADADLSDVFSGYLPRFSIDGSIGLQNYNSYPQSGTPINTNLFPLTIGATVRQLIYDGGATINAIEASRLRQSSIDFLFKQVKQDVLLDSLEAHIDLAKNYQSLGIARQSLINIKRQVELERTRLERGRGNASDLVRAQTQEATVDAALVQEELLLNQSFNRYYEIFVHTPILGNLEAILLPDGAIPQTLQDAIDGALMSDYGLKAQTLARDALQEETIRSWRSEFLPKLDLVGKFSSELNKDGVQRTKNDLSILAEFSYKLDFGSRARSELVETSLLRVEQDIIARKRSIEREVRDAWYIFQESKKTYALLQKRVSLASNFLSIARREREIGRQTLLEVLSGENELYFAQIEAVKGKARHVLASYVLLKSLGVLDIAVVNVGDPVIALASFNER